MWQIVGTTSSPGPRAWNQTAYDGTRILLAGGGDGGGAYRNDLWSFDTDWLNLIPNNQGPDPREHHAFVRAGDGYSYFYNGHFGPTQNGPEIIWRTNGTQWEDTGFVVEPGLPHRMSAGNCFVPPLNGILTVGGSNTHGVTARILRLPLNGSWDQFQLTGDPIVRSGETYRFNINNQMVWVPELNAVVLFGGAINGGNGLTHARFTVIELDGRVHDEVVAGPVGRCNAALVYRPGKLAIIGGTHRLTTAATSVRLKDFWEVDLATMQATQREDLPFAIWFHGAHWHKGAYVCVAGQANATADRGKTLSYTPVSSGIQMMTPSSISVEMH